MYINVNKDVTIENQISQYNGSSVGCDDSNIELTGGVDPQDFINSVCIDCKNICSNDCSSDFISMMDPLTPCKNYQDDILHVEFSEIGSSVFNEGLSVDHLFNSSSCSLNCANLVINQLVLENDFVNDKVNTGSKEIVNLEVELCCAEHLDGSNVVRNVDAELLDIDRSDYTDALSIDCSFVAHDSSNYDNVSEQSALLNDASNSSGLLQCNAQQVNTNIDSSEKDDCGDPVMVHLKETRSKFGKNLIFAHVNINSLSKCKEYVLEILQLKYIDVLCITESKLSDTDMNCEYEVDGYKLYREDRLANSGGMIVWFRCDIPHKRNNELEFTSYDPHIESMLFSFTVKKQTWYLIFVYKNPKVSEKIFVEKLISAYNSMTSLGKEIILLGDVNINMLKGDDKLTNDLCHIFGLKNLVTEPTCFKTVNGTLIDPVIVMNPKRFQNPLNIVFGYSDFHNIVGCITKLKVPPKKPMTVEYRSYKNFNVESFNADVSSIPFHVCEMFDDVDDKYWCMSKLFTDVVDEHAPLKKRVIRTQQVPYMHSELRKSMYKRNMLKNKYFKNRSVEAWHAYCTQRNITTNMRRNAIKSYFMSKCNGNATPKDFWNCIKPYMSNSMQQHRNIILNEDGNIITNKKDICEIFVDFFSSVADNIGVPDELDPTCETSLTDVYKKHESHSAILNIKQNAPKYDTEFNFSEVSPSYVARLLSKINVKKATGYDRLPPKLINVSDRHLSASLAEVINASFSACEYPNDMKRAEISPLFKKKDDMLKENYRPVSILVTFSKVFESIISEQLMALFNTIFDDMLCAYRKRYSCDHALIKVVDSWKRALDENKFVGVISMDLSKAFDCIPHGLLISKLKVYGLSDRACLFMSSYLGGRTQRVKIEDERSEWKPLKKGVPQGSCLGPIIFNIFLNDLFYSLKNCNLTNYADDNTIHASDISMQSVLQALQMDTSNAIKWFAENFMQANAEKFQFLLMKPLLTTDLIPDHIVIDNTRIQREENIKFLGITIDDKLKFDVHVANLCIKAGNQLNVLYRFKNIFNVEEKKLVYQTFVLSNFNYCPIVWNFCSTSMIRKMEYIQERALRFIYNDFKSEYREMLEMYGHETLHVRRIKTIASEVYKTIHSLNPTFMKEMILEKELTYCLRDGFKVAIPKFNKIRYGRNTFSYYGPHIWNILPSDIKGAISIQVFKKMLKKWEGPNCACTACHLAV